MLFYFSLQTPILDKTKQVSCFLVDYELIFQLGFNVISFSVHHLYMKMLLIYNDRNK